VARVLGHWVAGVDPETRRDFRFDFDRWADAAVAAEATAEHWTIGPRCDCGNPEVNVIKLFTDVI
jgi:hypothetical protein